MIDYIESASISKHADGQGNEDRLFMRDNLCAVIDGATTKHLGPGATGATVADLVCDSLSRATLDDGLPQLVRIISQHVRDGLSGRTAPHTRPSATLLLYSAVHRQVLRVGDSHLAINGEAVRGAKQIDRLLAEVRSLYVRLSGSWTAEDDTGRALILPVLRQQYRLQNSLAFDEYGYGCIDGSAVPGRFIETWNVPDGAEIILCSDGYLSPAPTLAQAEAELHEALKADPACIGTLKGTKGLNARQVSFDDRSYVRLHTR
ncbi:MAG: protein phosphatase 2C domain-containing protein [Pararhodobacter sp.]|nr:protein phosphatase 2C domain-containing protein [Pararhodobacter sp.]